MKLTAPKIAASVAALLALLVVATSPHLLGSHMGRALDGLAGASRPWLALAGVGFLASVLCAVAAWRRAIRTCGGEIAPVESAARFGVGSLVNSVAPAKLGDAVRIALLSKAIDAPGRLWTTGGVYAAVAAARAVCISCLVIVAFATGALPLWPVFALLGGVAVIAVVALLGRGHGGRIGHVFDALAALEHSPRQALELLGWIAASTAARLGAATFVALALGVPHPLLAALVILPVLDLAGLMPLTPGNLGVASGAIAVALQARGVGMTQALATGLAFHAVETMIGIGFGTLSGLYLLRLRPAFRRWTVRVALVGASATLAFAFGVLLFDLG